MSKDPAGRPQSAAAVAATARALLARHAEPPPAESPSASFPTLLPLAAEAGHSDTELEPAAPPNRPRWPWAVAAALLLLAAVPLVLWLAGALGGKPGDGTVKKGEEPPPAPKPEGPPNGPPGPGQKGAPADPDRAAAEYVLSVGGKVCVNRSDAYIRAKAGLPAEPFRLTQVVIEERDRVTDRGLAAFAGCRNVTHLICKGCPIGDAGLAHFKGCAGLMYLDLKATRVTSDGLAVLAHFPALLELDVSQNAAVGDAAVPHIRHCTKLHAFDSRQTSITPAGLKALKGALPDWAGPVAGARPPADPDRAAALWVLGLGGCVNVNDEEEAVTDPKGLPPGPFRLAQVTLTENPKVTDDGLAVLAGCRHLIFIGLNGTRTGDAGLAHLRECRKLMYVYLKGTDVTSAGLSALQDWSEVQELDVSYTKVDDAGLGRLKHLTKMYALFAQETRVTPAGVADLKKALPNCQVTTKPEAAEPGVGADRAAALWVLAAGGVAQLDGATEVRAAGALPEGPFELTGARLHKSPNVTDAGLAALARCKGLAALDLSGTAVGDAGLRHLAGCAALRALDLYDTNVGSAGLAHLKGCTALEELALARTRVGDAGLAHLAACRNLKELYLFGTAVGDPSLGRLKQFPKLAVLELRQSKVSARGVLELAAALPGCRIPHDGGTFEPAGPADRAAAAWVLSVGGGVHLNGDPGALSGGAAKLPPGPVRLTGVNLRSNRQVRDADLAKLKECKSLTYLGLSQTPIGDDGLRHLKGCANVTSLDLSLTGTTDAGLAAFKDCEHLTDMYLHSTGVTDDGLALLRGRKRLATVYLTNAARVTDAGLAHLHTCPALEFLYLKGTKVSPPGIDAARKALPGCRIEWDKGVLQPTK